jgi:hypothetical protein
MHGWAGCGPGDSAGLDEPQKAHVFLLWAHPMRVAPQCCLRARMSDLVMLMALSGSVTPDPPTRQPPATPRAGAALERLG